jgi:hypothetical protein
LHWNKLRSGKLGRSEIGLIGISWEQLKQEATMTILLIVSFAVLILSGIVDYWTGKKAESVGAVEKNPLGELIACFGSVILIGGFGVAIGFALHAPLCLGFAGWHYWASWHNWGIYKRRK